MAGVLLFNGLILNGFTVRKEENSHILEVNSNILAIQCPKI